MAPRPSRVTARRAILVIGCHRSGTSAMTHALSLIGAAMPLSPLPPAADNPQGFWEPPAVVALNEALLAQLGTRWDDPLGLGVLRTWVADDAIVAGAGRALGEGFPDAPLIAVKDPRLSLFAPLWIRAARLRRFSPAAVIMVRSPGEVAASLSGRNGLSEARAILLWARYMVAAERHTRDIPRVFVGFDDLIDRPHQVLERIRLWLRLDPGGLDAEDATRIVRPDGPRHRGATRTGSLLHPEIRALVEALASATRGGGLRRRPIDRCGDWLANLEELLTPLLRDERALNEFLSSEIAKHKAFEQHLNVGVEALRAEIDRLTRLNLAQQAEIVRLTAAHGAPDSD